MKSLASVGAFLIGFFAAAFVFLSLVTIVILFVWNGWGLNVRSVYGVDSDLSFWQGFVTAILVAALRARKVPK